MSAKEKGMLMYMVILQAHRFLGALQAILRVLQAISGANDNAELHLPKVYRQVREEIIKSDDRRFGRAVKPLISVTWEELQSLLAGFGQRCDAEVLIGLFELETDELLWYGHGRRHCNASDAFDVEAYSLTWSTPTAQSPRGNIRIPDDSGILHVQHRARRDAAMVYVEYNFADPEHGLWVRCEFFLRTVR